MMRDSRTHVGTQTLLSLLCASVGCLSMEPISSYSEGRPEVSEAPILQEPALPPPELVEEPPPAAEPDVVEGTPGDGEVALDPGVIQEPLPVVEPECTGAGEFASADGASCYRNSSQNAAWPDALASCETWGGSLVNVDSPEEDTFLAERVPSTFWIAASDRVQEGRMLWSGGEQIAYFNWSPGQPDDFQGREDCVVKTAPAGTWNDRPCGNVIPYVCERGQD